MEDFLGIGGAVQQIQQWMPMIKVAFWIILAAFILLAIAIIAHIIKVTFAPLVRFCQWMCFHVPGQELNPVFAGISHGLRLAIWAVFMAAVGYGVFWYFGG